MTNDHSLLQRVEERIEERRIAYERDRDRLESSMTKLVSDISVANLRLARLETQLENIDINLTQLNGESRRRDLINRGTSAVGGAGILAAIVELGHTVGWW